MLGLAEVSLTAGNSAAAREAALAAARTLLERLPGCEGPNDYDPRPNA